MNALVYQGPKKLVLEKRAIPEPGPGEAVVRVNAVGICGSELEGYMGHSSIRKPPLVMGHEFCGTIASLNDVASAFRIGDRVIVNPLVACGNCDRCRIGKANICRNRQIIGIHRPGAFAEYVAVPVANMYVVPRGMDANLASLAEPLAVCIHALKLGLQPFKDAMIIGAGPIGLLTLQAAKVAGAGRVLMIDRHPNRLEYARQLGAETATPDLAEAAYRELFGHAGVDTIVDCVGVQATREQALQLVNPGGVVILVGLGQDQSLVSLNHAVRQEISLIGSYTYTLEDFEQAVNMLTQGKVTHSGWSAVCSLPEAIRAFDELTNGSAKYSKYMINP